MRIKLLVVLVLLLLAMADVSHAGGRCGRWGGGWGGWYGAGWGPGWGGWYGPGWGGWGGWGWGPSFGVSYVAPVVYRPVYVVQPRRVYATSAYATYSAPALYRAQTRLARLGYYRGPIDGDFGPMTNRAIRSYQADYGLPITGRLDSRTRASLGV